MTDRIYLRSRAEDEFEYVSAEELDSYLERIVPYVGWIIVHFNSLEDHISAFIRQAVLRDPIQDERLDVFLSEMMFAPKCRALLHLYGQMIEAKAVKYTHDDLNELEAMLLECAKRRNEYAHADWIGVKQESYVLVKAQSKKTGVFHRYKKFDVPRLEDDVEYLRKARFTLCDFNDAIHEQLHGSG
ncbi:MAG: hypothetical protein JNL85_13615 [Rubrivivax sp.]|nr:hypothetical protein [Rubrivivax sp.]